MHERWMAGPVSILLTSLLVGAIASGCDEFEGSRDGGRARGGDGGPILADGDDGPRERGEGAGIGGGGRGSGSGEDGAAGAIGGAGGSQGGGNGGAAGASGSGQAAGRPPGDGGDQGGAAGGEGGGSRAGGRAGAGETGGSGPGGAGEGGGTGEGEGQGGVGGAFDAGPSDAEVRARAWLGRWSGMLHYEVIELADPTDPFSLMLFKRTAPIELRVDRYREDGEPGWATLEGRISIGHCLVSTEFTGQVFRGDELTQVPVPRVSMTAAGESNLGLMVSAQMSGQRPDELTVEGKLTFASYDRTEPCAQDNRPFSLTFFGPAGGSK
jgi:hypothetical protein